MIKLTLTGRTYGIRYTLRDLGFRWHPDTKIWYTFFDDGEEKSAEELATRWTIEGVYGKTEYIEGKVKTRKKLKY